METDLSPLSRSPKNVSSPVWRISLLALLAVIVSLVFMTLHLQGNISYVLKHRGQILFTIVLVAFASGISTLLFQTITQNRILSPSVMGLESLFVFIQTLLVFFVQLS